MTTLVVRRQQQPCISRTPSFSLRSLRGRGVTVHGVPCLHRGTHTLPTIATSFLAVFTAASHLDLAWVHQTPYLNLDPSRLRPGGV